MTDETQKALKELRKEVREVDRWYQKRREELLADVEEERRRRWRDIRAACLELSGHAFEPLPDNGFNKYNPNGEWPAKCTWCDQPGWSKVIGGSN